jgi:hypothetical protein
MPFHWVSGIALYTYRDADKSLALPARKQTNVSVRMAWISFGALPCRKKKKLVTARVSMLLRSRASLTCFRACFLPGRARDLSAPRYNNKSSWEKPQSIMTAGFTRMKWERAIPQHLVAEMWNTCHSLFWRRLQGNYGTALIPTLSP